MRKPPAATAAVSAAEPVANAVAAHATTVVTRCPPGLMRCALDSCSLAPAKRVPQPSHSRTPCGNQIYFVVGPEHGGESVSEYVSVSIFAAFIVAFAVVSL